MQALQVIARAEGGAEGGERQQADGHGIGTEMLQQLARHQRAQQDPEQHQHRLGQVGGDGHLPSRHRRGGHRQHRAGDQLAGQSRDEKQDAPDRADRKRFDELEGLGATNAVNLKFLSVLAVVSS